MMGHALWTMYVRGQWKETQKVHEIRSPSRGDVVGVVSCADAEHVELALASAVRGAEVMAKLTAFERSKILRAAAEKMRENADKLAQTISLEEGKPITESRWEVTQSIETMIDSAEEAKRIHGETLPLDAAPHGKGKMGLTLRVPCGVVVAICPFNFPLLLVCHKVGPAIAGGNAIILKPATDTPLSSFKLTELLLEAGLPPEAIQTLTGSGAEVGERLVSDPRVRKVTFTGSRAVGERITRLVGIKRVTMELGNNAPVIVMEDADLELAARAIAATGFANAGQTCISAQRVLAADRVYGDLIDVLKAKVGVLKTGDSLDESVNVGPMVSEREAIRVQEVVQRAAEGGARVILGGKRERALYQPTIVADVNAGMQIFCDELFGPAVAVTKVASIDEAIAAANDSPYGLSASIFTSRVDWAWRFAREMEAGNLHINWGPQWRSSAMPFGGLKESGYGREGPSYAVLEMTEAKTVVFHL